MDELVAVRFKREVKQKGVKEQGKAMYQHPDDASKTWTGKGKAPEWINDLCGTDKAKREQYLIR